MDGTIIQQGSFTSAGLPVTLSVRSDIDWMKVYNYTEAGLTNNAHGVQYFWQRGLVAYDGFVYIRPAGTTALGLTTSLAVAGGPVDGFLLANSSSDPVSAPVTVTGVTAGPPPLVQTGSTAHVYPGTIVRLASIVGGRQLSGIDFTVGAVVANTSFELVNMPAIIAAAAPGAAAAYRIVPFDPIFYPDKRTIASITLAANPTVVTTVDHGYTVGQAIRFDVVSSVNGMPQINGLIGNVLTVPNSHSFTIDINTTAFTPFVFGLTAQAPFTPAQTVPVGEALNPVNTLGDATNNVGFIGMTLFPGITSPAGTTGQLIYWVAGKSFNL